MLSTLKLAIFFTPAVQSILAAGVVILLLELCLFMKK